MSYSEREIIQFAPRRHVSLLPASTANERDTQALSEFGWPMTIDALSIVIEAGDFIASKFDCILLRYRLVWSNDTVKILWRQSNSEVERP